MRLGEAENWTGVLVAVRNVMGACVLQRASGDVILPVGTVCMILEVPGGRFSRAFVLSDTGLLGYVWEFEIERI